jgi:hypothetical protein
MRRIKGKLIDADRSGALLRWAHNPEVRNTQAQCLNQAPGGGFCPNELSFLVGIPDDGLTSAAVRRLLYRPTGPLRR